MGIISQLLGQILVFIYENLSFGSYGLAIILFTVFIKLLLLPLSIKQYKSSLKMAGNAAFDTGNSEKIQK